MKNHMKYISVVSLLALAACGGSGGGTGGNSADGGQHREMQETEGQYRAILRPLNHALSGWFPNGKADIKISGDSVEVKSWMDDSANVVHIQSIHAGLRCPRAEDDKNRDGVVDYAEAVAVAKPVLVPLDGNLNSQLDGMAMFPKGNFNYFQKASLQSLMGDLTAADDNTSDHIVKLAPGKTLDLSGRVVMVHGIVSNRPLPGSVGVIAGLTPQASVPIACGVIERL
jgi:hypothetical protein